MALLARYALMVAAALAVSPFVLSGTSEAQEQPARRIWPPNPGWSAVTATIEDGMGRPLRTFMHGGQTFVLGQFGQRYNIRIRNPQNFRVEVVVTVDGRDVVSGKPGDFVNNRGYVIGARDSLVIEGFRTSQSEVAAFRFTDPDDSYSARMGTPQNVGVIGVAFFGERRAEPPQEIARAKPKRSAAPRKDEGRARSSDGASGAAEPRAQNLGTEFGESMSSQVREVAFQRENPRRPSRIIGLRYDDARGLEARGIDVFGERRAAQGVEPEAFPESRFAPPPPAR